MALARNLAYVAPRDPRPSLEFVPLRAPRHLRPFAIGSILVFLLLQLFAPRPPETFSGLRPSCYSGGCARIAWLFSAWCFVMGRGLGPSSLSSQSECARMGGSNGVKDRARNDSHFAFDPEANICVLEFC